MNKSKIIFWYQVSWYEGCVFCSRSFSSFSEAIDCFRSKRSCSFVDCLTLTYTG